MGQDVQSSEAEVEKRAPPCPLCRKPGRFHASASDIEYFTTDQTFEYFSCDRCDVLFIHSMLADQLSLIYPSNYYSFKVGERRNWAVRIKEMLDAVLLKRLLRSIAGDDIRILDIGGGTGWLSDIARRADPRISTTQIVDLDPLAKASAEQAGHRYFCGRIEDFVSDERFDLILMLNLIEHVPQPEDLLRQVNRLITPRGKVLIKTPNFRALDAVIFKNRSWGGYHCPRHFIIFNREGIERLLIRTGFRIETFSYTQGAPFWSVSIMEALRRRGWIDVGPERPVSEHPLLPFLNMIMAAFDFARRPFSTLSQMIIVAGVNEKPQKPFRDG